MCGIIGYVGNKKNANNVLLRGLQALEYRGYDSAGIATVVDHAVCIRKSKGKVSQLKDKLIKEQHQESDIGIGHTRWATHGIPSENNAHPHKVNHITVVHNGIIENYESIKQELIKRGYVFVSQTDTEVCAALIDDCYQQTQDKIQALKQAYERMEGSFALAILFDDALDVIYAMRMDSPLVIANIDSCGFLASDISPILAYTNAYFLLEPREIAKISKNETSFVHLDFGPIKKKVLYSALTSETVQKNGYEHFMLKEIHEEPEIIANLLQYYVSYGEVNRLLHFPDFSKYKQLHIVGCGSAMHAGMIGKYMIEKQTRIPVMVDIASEYRYRNPILTQETLVIVISQSGETADSLAALRHVKNMGIDTLAIVNVMDSSIALEADFTCMTLARTEISVATTKAFLAQVMVLSLICLALRPASEVSDTLDAAKQLPNLLESVLHQTQYQTQAIWLSEHEHVFYLGRGMDYALSLEACLKLKEIAYIHCEAYPAGELKHGSIALIEDGTPVIAILSDASLYKKTVSNMEEVKSRGARLIAVTTSEIAKMLSFDQDVITIPDCHAFFTPILMMVPLQLLAYEVAKLRGCAIDQPRNLAKSVTVE